MRYMDDTAVAEFRGGQVLDRANLVNALKGASMEIITGSDRLFTRTEGPQSWYRPFRSNFSPTQERDKWRVPL